MPKGFSERVMEHFLHPRHGTPLAKVHGTGWVDRGENRFMRIQVFLEGNRIAQIAFATYGCAPAIASGSYVCEWVCHKSLQEAHTLTAEAALEAFEGLPEHRRDCAYMAIEALHQAISNAVAARKGD